jgi:polyribonucleotide nucleotidyltransferase
LSWDGENDPDVPGLIAASFALSISQIPWHGPIGAVRIGRTNGEWIVNPTYAQRLEGNFDLTLAGIEDEKKRV